LIRFLEAFDEHRFSFAHLESADLIRAREIMQKFSDIPKLDFEILRRRDGEPMFIVPDFDIS